jgi:hypothetical protein
MTIIKNYIEMGIEVEDRKLYVEEESMNLLGIQHPIPVSASVFNGQQVPQWKLNI